MASERNGKNGKKENALSIPAEPTPKISKLGSAFAKLVTERSPLEPRFFLRTKFTNSCVKSGWSLGQHLDWKRDGVQSIPRRKRSHHGFSRRAPVEECALAILSESLLDFWYNPLLRMEVLNTADLPSAQSRVGILQRVLQ